MESHLHINYCWKKISFFFPDLFPRKHHLVVSCKDFEDLLPHNRILLDSVFS